MTYIKRHAEEKFIRMNDFFKAVLVTGARQVGKTTMMMHLAKKQNRTYVTLDNLMARKLAKTDPELFFQTYKPPIIIDEVQYAPELFSQIKIICDHSEVAGQFWLTGSQQFNMMKNIRESLAGRLGIMELFSMTNREKQGVSFTNTLDFSIEVLQERSGRTGKNDVIEVYEHIWRGGMPQLLTASDEERAMYFNAYVNTYLMRDVVDVGGVQDSVRFADFVTASAALVGQQVKYKTLADAVGISQPTAKEWLRILQGMGIVYLLKPYSNNALKRLVKTPKLYFCDTGLAAYLSMWPTADTLRNGAASGYFYENYVVMALLKNYTYSNKSVQMTYYRDANGKEIDVVIEQGKTLHPLEIKRSANPDQREVKKFQVFEKFHLDRGPGGIICMCSEPVPIDQNNSYIPSHLI